MICLAHPPGRRIAHAVALLWYQEVVPGQFGPELVLPAGTAELVIALGVAGQVPATGTLCGPHSTYFCLERPQVPHAVVGAHFRPGGIRWMVEAPQGRAASAHELHNQIITLEDLWGRDALRVHERLLHGGTPGERLQLLEHALERRIMASEATHHAVAAAVYLLQRTLRPRPVAAVAAQLGYSVRRLQQQFQQAVGLSPKLFQRVSRFQTLLQTLDDEVPLDWSALALAHGYCDQAHLINEVHTFTSMAPTAVLQHRTAQTGHLRQRTPDPPPHR